MTLTARSASGSSPFGGAFRGRRVFVTGHTGFKGAWMCEWLLRLGAQVTGYSLAPPTSPSLFDQLGLAERIVHIEADIRNPERVAAEVARAEPEYIFHLAAQPLVRESYRTPVQTYETNVMGTIHVLEAARALSGPCAVVCVTTDKCYENRDWVYGYRESDALGGHDPYSSSKAAAEIAIASWRRSFFIDHPVKIASARAGNVIGGGDWATDRIVPDCVRALARGDAIMVRNRVATRPWQHVLEPVSGYLWLGALLSRLTSSQADPDSESALCAAFNFGPDHNANRCVGELVDEVLSHWPGRWEPSAEPNAVHEARLLQLATDRADSVLRWSPVWGFAESVRETIRWYRSAGDISSPERFRELTVQQIASYEAAAVDSGVAWCQPA